MSKEVAIQTADGAEALFQVDMFPVEAEKTMVAGSATKLGSNIAEKKKLEETNQRLLNLVHAASNAIWEWDIKTGKTFRNQTLLDMIGYANEDTHGLTWWLQQIHPVDRNRIYEHVKKAIQKKETSWSDTYQFKCKNGLYKQIADRGIIIYEYGFPVKMIGSLKDITDVKELEAQLAEERLQKQKEISEKVIAVLERERTLIGHELHDNVNQILAVIGLCAGMLTPATEEEKQIKSKIVEQINTAMEEIRSLSKELVVPHLKQKGLVASIHELIDEIQFSNTMKIVFVHDLQTYPISSGKKVTLFRIVQEQLKNILKYSRANNVDIRLSLKPDEVELLIKDNGVGFDAEKTFRGIGLSNIHERTRFYNGTVDIQTAEGKGCTLTVKIPLH